MGLIRQGPERTMRMALTREVSPAMGSCELTYLERKPIDVGKAAKQHGAYREALAGRGLQVISLPAEPEFPDSVFVEDPVIVLDEIAVMGRMGAESRRKEGESLARALAPYRELARIEAPGTLEGGDVLRIGRDILAGLSPRSNAEGISQLAGIVRRFGYRVEAVRVSHCLHLKTACSYIGEETILVNRAWVDSQRLKKWRMKEVAAEEPWAANALRIGDTVLFPAGFPRTEEILVRAGFQVQTLELSELQKAEGSVTCMSVIFEV